MLFDVYYVNPQERKPQAQRDWLDLLQGRAHNVHEVDVCALSLLWAGMIAALGSLLCQGIEFLEEHEGDRYFN